MSVLKREHWVYLFGPNILCGLAKHLQKNDDLGVSRHIGLTIEPDPTNDTAQIFVHYLDSLDNPMECFKAIVKREKIDDCIPLDQIIDDILDQLVEYVNIEPFALSAPNRFYWKWSVGWDQWEIWEIEGC